MRTHLEAHVGDGEQPLSYPQRQAAAALGVSVNFLRKHVLPDLAVARVGRRTLIPRVELERWLERQAEKATAEQHRR